MPVVFAAPIEVEGPRTRVVVPVRRIVRQWEGEGGVRSFCWHLPYRCVHFSDIDLEFGSETRAEFSIVDENPARASVRFEHRLHFARAGWEIDVTGTAQLRSTPCAFHPSASLEARENGETVFERRWDPEIPRTCS